MNVNGTQFDVEVLDVVTELKEQLSANGIELFSRFFDSGDNVMVCCPYHKGGQERRPSAGIRKSDGLLHCLACGKTAGLDEMIANCFGYDDPVWGYRWLIHNFSTVKIEDRKDIELDFSRGGAIDPTCNRRTVVPESELDGYRYNHPYLYQRGLTDEIIGLFDIGYDRDTNSITFPVRSWDGEDFGKCLFVAKRSIPTKRFDLPKDLDKPLYGLYEIQNMLTHDYSSNATTGVIGFEEIYVCEGLFDCLRLWCNGNCAVAGFGCLYSEYQLKLLQELPTRKLILAFDNDNAGRDGAQRVRKAVRNKLITEVILPEGRKDIGECTDEEIKSLSEVFS